MRAPNQLAAYQATTHPLFQQMLVVNAGAEVDRDLLDYAAFLAEMNPGIAVDAVAIPTDRVLREWTLDVGAIFGAHGVRNVGRRLLAEPDLDACFEVIRTVKADLLVVRHPRSFPAGRTLSARLLTETPCSVCFVPNGAPPRIERIVAGITLDDKGAALLERAARLSSNAGTEDLYALNVCFRQTLAHGADVDERFRQEHLLALHRFMARVRLHGAPCTPLLEENPRYTRSILKTARMRLADFVIIGRDGIASSPLLSRRCNVEELLWDCDVPFLDMLLSEKKIRLLDELRERLSQDDPQFG